MRGRVGLQSRVCENRAADSSGTRAKGLRRTRRGAGRAAAALADAPRLVVVEGEPGIGKTMLVERFLEQTGGVRVLRASAVEPESDLPFGVAEQLLGPGHDGVHHLAVGARAARAASATWRPAVLVLDDVQWADQPSLSALLFALRRLAAEPVLVVATVRTGELPEALAKVAHGRLGTVLRPAPLDAAEVQRLAEALGLALAGARRAAAVPAHGRHPAVRPRAAGRAPP